MYNQDKIIKTCKILQEFLSWLKAATKMIDNFGHTLNRTVSMQMFRMWKTQTNLARLGSKLEFYP